MRRTLLYAALICLTANICIATPLLTAYRAETPPSIDGDLSDEMVTWKPQSAVCVVLSSGGYPGSYVKGYPIEGLEAADSLQGVTVFHAGTSISNGGVVTSGGRVLGVTALGDDLARAVDRCYTAVEKVQFKDSFHRKDIAHRAL